ncbi:MAG: sulfotransferase [Vannielia sp.]|uniref:sulfotransferase family protein n=1 Tax=Vannielia sp. TaxID=2813045 RepID=UPI003B8DB757
MTSKVDCFLVGAPKCGSTALAANLEQHPNIVFSKPKEPHFFTSDLPEDFEKPNTIEGYHAKYFPQEKRSGDLWCDGSIWSMYSEVAIGSIKEYNSEAKIIAVLRNPARAAFSLHQQHIFQRNEDVYDFTEAWKMSDLRYDRLKTAPQCSHDPRTLAYRQAFDFYAQISRIYESFSPENVMLIRQQDLADNSKSVLSEVCRFLEVEKFDFPLAIRVNETFYMGEGGVMRALRSRASVRAVRTLKKLLGVKSLGVGRPSARFRPEYQDLVMKDLSCSLKKVKSEFGLDLI